MNVEKTAPQRLKEAVIETIVARGYGNATLAPILQRGGLSKGALFHHFKSREDLAAAAYADLLSGVMKDMAALAAALRGSDIDLRTFLLGIAKMFSSDTMIATMEIALAVRVSPNLYDLVSERISEWDQFLSVFWGDLFEISDVDEDVQQAHWLMVTDIFRGIGVQYAFNLHAKHIEGIVDRVVTTCFSNVHIRPVQVRS